MGIPDILSATRIRGGYPSEKPPSLAETLIRQSTEPGMVVADPFMGSGSTGAAALALERQFAGCDISSEAIEYTKSRLRTVAEQAGEDAP